MVVAGALVAGAVGVGLPSASAAPALRLWRVTRVRADRPVALSLRAVVQPRAAGWMAVVARVSGTRTRRTATPVSMVMPSQEPVVYDGGTAIRLCPTCEDATGAQEVGVDRDRTADEFLVAVREGSAVVSASTGWRVREVAPTALRSATVEGVTATGAAAQVLAVERFRAASLAGGRYGSLAWLRLSCGAAGTGTVTLAPSPRRPGDGTGTADCDAREPGTWASTPGGVTWRANGDAVGVGAGPSMLVVLDLPRT